MRTAFVLTVTEAEFVAVVESSEVPQVPSIQQSVTVAENAWDPTAMPDVRYFATTIPSQSPGNSYENPVLQMEALDIEEQSESVTEYETGTRPEGKFEIPTRCFLWLDASGETNERTKTKLPLELTVRSRT